MNTKLGIAICVSLFVVTFFGTLVFLYLVKARNLAAAQRVTTHGEIEFRPVTVFGGGMPPITNIPHKKVSEIKADNLEFPDNSLVLGVTVNGESRAYPLNQLIGPDREIFNDVLGGRAIMPTW